ncbi:TadG family pilus assembly protein [Henriciella sp.]|uniref:TadG family pilus assembly protein n=1 Tax=Henriciella sp. TaxID=1968823 RepID=UPI00262FD33B|nr:TadG family pilus assembly protein [Henriciella sp.]
MGGFGKAWAVVSGWPANARGNVAVIAAICAPMIAVMAALAVDTGVIASEERRMQGLVDIAAISAAGDIENAKQAAYSALAVNGFGGKYTVNAETGALSDKLKARLDESVNVATGRYKPDPEMRFASRFVEGGYPVNAVRVRIEREQPRYFGAFANGRQDIVVTGTAAVTSEAAISVGSRLLGLNDGILNSLLSKLTGSEVELSVMDYRALAKADVDLLKMFDALATDLELDAATYDDVLDFNVALADLADAMAEVAGDDSRAIAALGSLAGIPGFAEVTVPLATLFDLGSAGSASLGTPAKGLDLNVDALQMLSAGAIVSNGENQIDLDLDADVPGLVAVKASLLVGERPRGTTWFSLSDHSGGVASTAQARLFLETKLAGLDLLGGDLVRLPLYLELAPAEATVSSVVCKSGRQAADRVDIDVTPGILTLRIADLKSGIESVTRTQRFRPAEILDARLVRIKASAHSSMVSSEPTRLRYYSREIGSGEPKTARTQDVLGEALESAVRDLELDVDVAGLSLVSPKVVQKLVGGVLGEAVEPVDELVFNLTTALGLGLGEADVWVHDARCNRSVLVQ